ncbi:MAG: ABC transporter substrate-binding protein [Actinomycetota bacterium]|nr:ABC transporter substrate-binding protein [Actinomycetota bacterium]
MRHACTRVLCALGVLLMTAGAGTVASGGTAGAGISATATPLNIADEYGETWPCHFNPYNPTDGTFSFGYIYEELAFEDALRPQTITPWLATKWTWSNTNKTLTFTIRKGVTWSSGKPFTAADVVFSFNLMKRHPALDGNADWSVLSSVTQQGTDQVVFQFKHVAVPYFYSIATKTPIVPEYIWSKVKNPTTFLDNHPIGTGPYVVESCSGSDVEYKANPHYWQAGLPKIKTVNFPAYLSNTPANEDLASGKDQWGAQYIPGIKKTYIDKNPKYFHAWSPPVSTVSIFINLKNKILSNVAVRRAMSYAIDKPKVAKIGEGGEELPANQTGVPLPTFKTWYDSSLAKRYGNAYAYDPKKALAILQHAGFKKGPTGVMHKGNEKLSFTMVNNGTYSDWVASANVAIAELAKVGIQVTARNYENTTYTARVQTGKYQLAWNAFTGGPGPYYEFETLLNDATTAPIGKTANGDYERYASPETQKLFEEFTSTTTSAKQHQIVDDLEKVMLTDVPTIPVTEQPDWYQYDTQCIGGWPTPKDPYAQPSQYVTPDAAVVLLHLYPKAGCK